MTAENRNATMSGREKALVLKGFVNSRWKNVPPKASEQIFSDVVEITWPHTMSGQSTTVKHSQLGVAEFAPQGLANHERGCRPIMSRLPSFVYLDLISF